MARQEGTQKIGSFESKSGRLCAFDPYCSGVDVQIDNCAKGAWDAFVTFRNQHEWGFRESDLTVVVQGLDPSTMSFTEDVGTVMVDAACAGVYDLSQHNGDCEDLYAVANQKVCSFGACSLSGFGDGCYGVFVARGLSGTVVGVQIVFIPEDNDPRFPEEEPICFADE